MRGVPEQPQGLRYVPDLLDPTAEAALLARLGAMAWHEVRTHGQAARRVVRHFGVDYAYETGALTPGEPLPPWLEELRAACAALVGVPADALAEALLTCYPVGATIGWHRDAPAFGDVVGVSLGAACTMRFQRGAGEGRRVHEQRLEPRSAYVLAGPSRTSWQHSIPAVQEERCSVAFRTLRRPRG